MKDSFSLAKITRPSLSNALPRDRLFRLLAGARQKPMIWFSAPAGSGKTTLASSYLQTFEAPCLWYQIDEGDSDIASFFFYMGLAFKNAAPQEEPLPLLTPEYALGIPTFTRRFFEDLFAKLPKPISLVLDNYQEVSGDSPLHQVVRNALDVVPNGATVFILSRNDFPKQFARLKANQSVSIVGWDELRFTQQESHDLVHLIVREGLNEELIDLLHRRMDGWAAGLILMLSQPGIRSLKPEQLSNYKPGEIFDYFAAELYENVDNTLRDFLVRTSIFPRMTASMAAELAGEPQAEDILSGLVKGHFFTQKHLGSPTVYQYHSIFREFLREKAQETISDTTLGRMKQEAATLLEKEGHAEDAVALYKESGDLTRMIKLLLSLAPELMTQGRHQTLEQWISSLPDEMINDSPWLLYWLASSYIPVNPQASAALFKKALFMFEEGKETEGMLITLSGILISIAYAMDDLTLFDEWIPRVEEFRERYYDQLSLQNKAVVALSMLHALFLRQPNHPSFETWEKLALQMLDTGLGLDLKFQLLLPLTINRTYSGDLETAESFIGKFRTLADHINIRPLDLITMGDAEIFNSWLKADFQNSRKVCSETIKLAEDSGVHTMVTLLNGHGAASELSQGNLEAANQHIKKMESTIGKTGEWEKCYCLFLITWKYLLENDFINARLIADQSVKSSKKTGVPHSIATTLLGFALALHRLGEHEPAVESLNESLSICCRITIKQVEFACLLAQAEFALDLNDLDGARAFLRKALSLGRRHSYFNIYFWRSDVMARICAVALEAGIEVEYVKALITKRNLVPDQSTGLTDNWPWKLKIRTLGGFRVVKDEDPLKFKRKAPNKVLSMLKLLTALGGEIQKERIIDILWPDAEGDNGNQTFATTLYRLRRLLGYSEAVELVESKVRLNPNCCWVDSLAFEHFLDRADEAWRDELSDREKAKVISLMKKGLDLYKGDFLVDEMEEPWIISARKRLLSKFLRAAVRLQRLSEQKIT